MAHDAYVAVPFMDADKVTYPTFLSSSGPMVLAIVRWADSSYFSLCIYFDAVLGLQSSGKLWENLKVNVFQLFPAAHEFYLTSFSKRGGRIEHRKPTSVTGVDPGCWISQFKARLRTLEAACAMLMPYK